MSSRTGRIVGWILVSWAGIAGSPGVRGATHQHLNAGAYGSEVGAALYFVNGDRFVASSGYAVPMERASVGAHGGLYRGGITLTALPATLDYGGPTFDHAALGAQLEVVVEELEGPSGGRFGFWESVEDEEGPSATFEVPSGLRGGTNRFLLSQTGGAEGVDPYGHVHGRVFTATEPGLYAVGLRLREVSSNGPGGGPLHRESEVFRLQFQAGITIARIVPDGDDVRVVFATAVGYAYRVETSETLGPGAAWLPVGEVVRGDDRLREVRLPKGKATGFFRLRREVS